MDNITANRLSALARELGAEARKVTPLSDFVTDRAIAIAAESPDTYTDDFGTLEVNKPELEETASYLLELYAPEDIEVEPEVWAEAEAEVYSRLAKVAQQNIPSAEEWAELADDGSDFTPHLA